MTPRSRDTSGGPVHPFCNADGTAAVTPRVRDTPGGPVHPFCNANRMVGVAA
jgi:hypothetical protein